MAIQYVVRQDTRKNGNHLWYGRAIHTGTIGLEELADRVQKNCSMTKGDVLAVMTEMISVMNDYLGKSFKVKLDGLGIFGINLRTKGANVAADFNAKDHIKAYVVNFFSARSIKNGKVTRVFTDGLTAVKAGVIETKPNKPNPGA